MITVTDIFAGAGGSSTGAAQVPGLDERRIREAEGQAVGRGDQDALDFGASA